MRFIILILVLFQLETGLAKEGKKGKVQEVNFEETGVDGQVRNPNGSYLVQKKGIDFVPLYKVRENFDESIKESVEYVK